jgi:hypothetical protein
MVGDLLLNHFITLKCHQWLTAASIFDTFRILGWCRNVMLCQFPLLQFQYYLFQQKATKLPCIFRNNIFMMLFFGFSSEFLIVLSYMHLGVPNLWSSWIAFEIHMKQSSLLTKHGCLPKVGINEHILKRYLLCYYSKKFHKCTIAKSRTWSNIWCQGSDLMELKWPSYVILWKSIIGKIK